MMKKIFYLLVLILPSSTFAHLPYFTKEMKRGPASFNSPGVIENFLSLKPFSEPIPLTKRDEKLEEITQRFLRPNPAKGETSLQPGMLSPSFFMKIGQALFGRTGWKEKLFKRYGFHDKAMGVDTTSPIAPDGTEVPTVSSCLTCHSGYLNGEITIGVNNNYLDLATMMEDRFQYIPYATYREVPRFLEVFQNSYDEGGLYLVYKRGAMLYDLGTFITNPGNHASTAGTNNAFGLGVKLFTWRNNDLTYYTPKGLFNLAPRYVPFRNVDLDTPPFWNVKYKKYFYYDATIYRSPRAIMQFLLVPGNSAEHVKNVEPLLKEFMALIDIMEPPKYPEKIIGILKRKGEKIFNNKCSSCHGVHSENGTYYRSVESFKYPEKVFSPEEIGTDPLRANAYGKYFEAAISDSWIGYEHQVPVNEDNAGNYVAPPLWGTWASAPYLHNGSIPTIYHLLEPKERPKTWRINNSENKVDYGRLGLSVDENVIRKDRKTFDSGLEGKSNLGHEIDYSDSNDPGKRAKDREALIEYLKTL